MDGMDGMEVATDVAFLVTYAVIVWVNRSWLGDQFRRWF